MSKDYEHQIANGIHDATDDSVRAYRIGFSGSSNKPNPDVLVTTPRDNHALEVKRTSQDTFYVEADDIQQLANCENSYTLPWLVVKFTHREPVTIRYFSEAAGVGDWEQLSVAERVSKVTPETFDSSVTDGGNLRLNRPSTDEWASSRGGVTDEVAVLRDIGIKNEESRIV
jgi:Holliday junction resolvase